MGIRTKVITTIIAMMCSLSVSATGIAAILMSYDVQVANATMLALSSVNGDLYGERYGAGATDFVSKHLFKSGEGVLQNEMDEFCQNVSFAPGSNQITYIFKFILANDEQSGAIITMDYADLTNKEIYTAEYNYSYGQIEPEDWATTEKFGPETKCVVNDSNPYLYLRATLKVNPNAYSRINTDATWSFSFNFEGVVVSE